MLAEALRDKLRRSAADYVRREHELEQTVAALAKNPGYRARLEVLRMASTYARNAQDEFEGAVRELIFTCAIGARR